MSHIIATFNCLYPKMLKNGVYVVEDLHTAYWAEYEGGLRKPTNFIEICKSLIDELNADHTRGALAPTEFTNSTIGMHFYDSVVVFERGTYTRKCAPVKGKKLDRVARWASAKLRRGYPPAIADGTKP